MRNGSSGSILDLRGLATRSILPTGRNRPDPDIGGQTETLKFTTAAPQIAEV
jgi:hypothetical protein